MQFWSQMCRISDTWCTSHSQQEMTTLYNVGSVLRGIALVVRKDSISTTEAVQYPTVLNSLHSTEPT